MRFLTLMLIALCLFGCEKKEAKEDKAPEKEAADAVTAEPAADTAPEPAREGGDVAEARADASGAEPPEGSLLPALSDEAKARVAETTHMIVVVTESWDAPDGKLALFERTADGWALTHGPFTSNVGYKGISWGRGLTMPPEGTEEPVKKEGDKTAPAGIFRVSKAMGYEAGAPEGMAIPYQTVDTNTHCVDDADSPKYNRIVQLDEGEDAEWSSSEILRRDDALYHLFLLIDHNGLIGDTETVPGSGSCIFLHEWGSEDMATVGCTSIDPTSLRDVLSALPSLDKTLFVQLPKAHYDEAIPQWGMPPMP